MKASCSWVTGVQDREGARGLTGARGAIERLQRVGRGEIDLLVAVLLEHGAELLGLFNRGGADQHRLQLGAGLVDLTHHRLQLLGAAAIDLVVFVLSAHRAMGRNFDDDELVDLREFVGLRRRRAGHARELLVETEIILEGDGSERDVFRLNRHALLGFQGLMETLGIRRPGIMRPVNSSTITTSPLRTMYSLSFWNSLCARSAWFT